MAINQIVLTGNVGQQPEVRYFESGTVKAQLSLAVKQQTRKGEPEVTDWFPVEFWGKTAEVVANYVRSGSLIGVTGSVYYQHWDDKETGKKRSKAIVKCNRLELLGRKPAEEEF